jgi:hypothetical protein
MAIRFYVLPLVETTLNGNIYRSPKYFQGSRGIQTATAGLENIHYDIIDYGFQPVCILGADMLAAQHTILSAQPDVLSVPLNIDNSLTAGAVTTVQNFLETLHIPANWVTTVLTYRDVLRQVGQLFYFMQRLHSKLPIKLFDGTVTLSNTFGSLSTTVQQALIDTATSFGFSTSGLTAGTTLRQILKALANNFGSSPLILFGQSI